MVMKLMRLFLNSHQPSSVGLSTNEMDDGGIIQLNRMLSAAILPLINISLVEISFQAMLNKNIFALSISLIN